MAAMNFVYVIIALFDYARMLFGLKVVRRTDAGLEVPTSQRFLALVWCAVYLAVTSMCETPNVILKMDIRNSLVALILPKVGGVVSITALAFTYILSHAFAKKRKRIIEEAVGIYPELGVEMKSVSRNAEGNKFIVAIGVAQLAHCIHWCYVIGFNVSERSLSAYAFVAATFPKLVSVFFLVDYVTAVVILIRQFIRINEDFMQIVTQKQSFSRNCILELTNRHKTLTKICKRMNGTYCFQMLLTVALIYIALIFSGYVGIYALLAARLYTAVISTIYLILNVAVLLLIVEITTQLSQEVSDRFYDEKNHLGDFRPKGQK